MDEEKKLSKNKIKKEEEKTSTSKTKKTATAKQTKTAVKKTTAKKTVPSTKKTSDNKTKKSTNTTSSTKSTSRKKSTKKDSNFIVEYYDLPYRYNQTIVKILAQTPTTLFVYWDISDDDRQNYINKYGFDFFEKTKPVLVIHNITNNYTYEIEINDFANSWYLKTEMPDCNYEIVLGRRNINNEYPIENDFVFVTSSNKLQTPNDHILLENIFDNSPISFKNVKTNVISTSTYGSLSFIPNLHSLYSVHKFYKTIYKNEFYNSDSNKTINTASSSFSL